MDSNQFDFDLSFDDSIEFMNLEVQDSPKKKLKISDKIVHKKPESFSGKQEVSDNNKNIKDNEDEQICKEFRNKILNNINQQFNSRKKMDETLQNKLIEAIGNLEEKYNILEKDVEKLEGVMNTTIKCLDETQIAFRQKIYYLVELKQNLINQCNNMQDESKQADLEKKLDAVMQKVKEELISVTKKKDFAMMTNFLHNMQKI